VVSINEDAHTENWGRFLLTMFFAVFFCSFFLQLNLVVDVNIYDLMVAHIRK
jgi:hypothetical protein